MSRSDFMRVEFALWSKAQILSFRIGFILSCYRRRSWCDDYRRRKFTRLLEFKTWTRLFAFHIALITLGKVWILLFFLQLCIDRRTELLFEIDIVTSLKKKNWIQTHSRPGEGWALRGYSYWRYTTWVPTLRPNRITRPVLCILLWTGCYFI